jgi:hypothetical protein
MYHSGGAMKNILGAILALLLITTACSPLPAKSTPIANKNVLFSDDFTDPKSGWDRFQDYAGVTDYANVGYLIYIKAANMIKWANPPKTFQNDLRIEVDTTMSFGPDNNAFGVICRYQDPDNFYYFYISSDGFGGIGKKQNGQHSIISSSDGKLLKVDGVNTGAASNHLRADCIGSTLTLYVNGTQIATTKDSSFTGGTVGLIARTYDTGGADILFNNFFVYKP